MNLDFNLDDLNAIADTPAAEPPKTTAVVEPKATPLTSASDEADSEPLAEEKSASSGSGNQRPWKEVATIVGGVSLFAGVFAWLLLTFVFVENPEDEVSLELPQNRTEAVMMELPIGGLQLETVIQKPPTALIIEIDASIIVHGTASELTKVEEMLKSHHHRIQEAIDETIRFSTPEQLNEADTLALRSRVRDQINEFFGKPVVKEVLFSHYRAFRTPIKR